VKTGVKLQSSLVSYQRYASIDLVISDGRASFPDLGNHPSASSPKGLGRGGLERYPMQLNGG